MTMLQLDDVIARVREECNEDYVGLWEIYRILEAKRGSAPDGPAVVTTIVRALLNDEGVAIGQFEDEVFAEWPGDRETKLKRLRSELENLGRAPNIGEVAWLAKR
jgi:hypothetical protein